MPEHTNSTEGACKRFECKVIGYPRPSIRWYKDGENITTHRRYKFDYTPDGCIVLIIDKVEPADQGVYACRAENSEGTAESSALLHVKGGILGQDDELTSVHSMTFRLLDSQKRPLVVEQKRQSSSEQSDDSVINNHSDSANDIAIDTTNNLTTDTPDSKWDANAKIDNGQGDLNDDSLNIKVDSHIDDEKRNYNELLAEVLTDIENSGDPRSRRWTADSGITSRGSSFSSDPDINIDHESMLEMQKYLHGKEDAIFESCEQDSLNTTDPKGRKIAVTNFIADNFIIESPETQITEFRSSNLKVEQEFIDKENIKNIKMEKGDLAILAYESYQVEDIGHHFCTSKQNHVDHIEADIDWEHVDDHEASILAGKYLFANGPDVEADAGIQPLSEWEMIKQTEGSQHISAANNDGQVVTESQAEQTYRSTKVESASKTFINDDKIAAINGEIEELSQKLLIVDPKNLTHHGVKEDYLNTGKNRACFSAQMQDTKIEKAEQQLTLTDLNVLETARETAIKDVSGTLKEAYQTEIIQQSTKGTAISSKEEFSGSTDDDDESYDLDVDRSEKIMLKRSQQYRRPSAQDSLTSEMVGQISTKETLSNRDDVISLETEITSEVYKENENAAKDYKLHSGMKNENRDEKADISDEDLSIATDDDSYELDLDRSEQMIAIKSQQVRRLSAQDSLTKEKVDQEMVKDTLTANDVEILLESETKALHMPEEEWHSGDDLDVDKKEEAVLARRSSLHKQHTQEQSASSKELNNVTQMNGRHSGDLAQIQQSEDILKELQVGEEVDSVTEVRQAILDLETENDGNIQDVPSEILESAMDTSCRAGHELAENEILNDIDTDGLIFESDKTEQKPKLCDVPIEDEILFTHEVDFIVESLEKLSLQASNKERGHISFEKLSSAEKDDILKQISDISLAKGKKGRQLKETNTENENVGDNKNVTEAEMSDNNETTPLISDVKDVEKNEQGITLDRQLSLTDAIEVKIDYSEAEPFKGQDNFECKLSALKTPTCPIADATLRKKALDECRVDEFISIEGNEQIFCTELESFDLNSANKAAIRNEDSILIATIENTKEPTEPLFQAEESPGNQDSKSSEAKEVLQLLDDTKPEVPNVINLVEDVKSKTELQCRLEEEKQAAQEVQSDISDDSEVVAIKNTNLIGFEAAVSREETGLITEGVKLLDIKTAIQSEVDKASTVTTESETAEIIIKDKAVELEHQNEQIHEDMVDDNQDEFPKDSKLKTKIEAAELKQILKPTQDAVVDDNESRNVRQTEKIEPVNIQEETGSVLQGVDTVDAELPRVINEHGPIIPVEKEVQAIEIECETGHISVREREPITLKWKITGVSLSEITVTKDGFKVQPDETLSIQSDSNILTLHIESASIDDEATYSAKGGDAESKEGTIVVQVVALETPRSESDVQSEPAFIVEPVLEKEDRRLSIKCSVSGFPQPNVTWYHHGQPLGSGEFWDVYSKDGYHYLANSDSSFLDCEEIVCRVENDSGFIQSVLQLSKKGDEIICVPVQRVAGCPSVDETSPVAPYIELQMTETSTKNLLAYTVGAPHTDQINQLTINKGDKVQLLGTYDTQQWLTRLVEEASKLCYVPVHLLEACVVATDARHQECRNVATNQITEQTNKTNSKPELQTPDTEELPSTTMPERRKIVPGSKLHGTQEVRDRESPTDIESKLGFKDELDKKKDVSDYPLSEYENGTSRPMFKKRLKTIVTRTGELVQMECIVRGTPLPKVLWLKNNRPLKESDNCQVIADEETNMLLFPEVSEDDIGVYTARAMNVNGSVMCSAELSLEDGRPLPYSEVAETPMDLDFTTPNYFFQMSSCQVAEGRMARFDCRVVAYPRPEIVWMRDGKVIEAGDRFRLLNMNNEIYSLLIQDVQMSDTGRYTCWARNKFGEAMTEAYLNVIAFTEQEEEGDIAPKFLTRFYDQQTTEGMATDFRCLIAGKPEPTVTWLLDDIELKDGPGMRQRHKDSMVSLEIKTPKLEQSGQYTCQLRNPLGEATCSAKLTVIEDKLHGKMLPKFLRKFDHLTIKDGEEAKFSCVIVGEPKADVVWMFDHKPIPDSNRRFVAKRDGDTYSLIVKNARFDDTGVITCKAVNDEGEVYCSANLLVRESKFGRETPERIGLKPEQKDSKFGYIPTFTKRLQDVEVSEGATAKFECRVMGIPEPEVTWMKDGRVIPTGGRYQMVRDGDTCYLQITNVTTSDTGVYTCILSNNQGKSSSSAALKMEGVPPKEKYIPEKAIEPYVKKERFTPERKLEDTYARKTRYTPEKFTEDAYAKKRYTPERFLEDTYVKKRYTPERFFEDTYTKQRYTPDKHLEDSYTKKARYTPDYLEDTYVKLYTPDRYALPESYLDQTPLKQPYLPTVKPEAIPKIAYDKPMLLHKTDESVRLSWTPVSTHNLPADSRRVSYIVESRELPSSMWTKLAYNVPGSSYLVRNLRPDKEYEFRVRAQNQHGISEPTRSATLERRVDESKRFAELPEMRAPPRLPTQRPIITDLGEEMVRLAWRPVETYKTSRIPPVSYQVEAKELPGKDWMPISTRLRDTTHYLSELEPDRDYLFRVRAENDFGVSEPTEPLWLPRAKVFPGVPISRPQIIEMEPHKAKLSWARVDVPAFGLDEVPLTYMLEVEEPPKDWRTLARDLDDTEYIIEGLKPERDYRFRVRAKTPTGVISEPSPAVSLYTTLAKTMAPVDRLEVLSYEPESRSLQLQWQRVEIPPYSSDDEPLMYMLEYQEPPLPDWRPLVTGIPTTRYRVMHLEPDRDYHFRVRALTPYGVSPPSPALPVTMRQPTAFRHLPEEVTISEVESDSLRLTWRRPLVDLATPVSYQVEMLEPLVADWRPIATRVTDTTYKVTGLKPTRDYQFRVIPYADTRALPSTPVVGLTSSPVRPRLHLSEPKIREMGPESVQLSWQQAELPLYQRSRTPISYNIEMMELPSTSWVPVARRVPDTSYMVTGLRADHDYKFRVTAETDLATSEPSLATFLHRKPAPIFPREEPTVRDFTPNAVMLSWQPAVIPEGISLPVTKPIFYSVEAQSPPGMGAWNTLYARHPTPSVKLSDLRPDLDYLVRVRAHYDDYTSEPTLPVYIPRRAAPPRISHEEPYAVEVGSDSVKLQWRSADLPIHIMDYAPVTYRIEAQELPGGNWVTVARGVPHTDFKVTGLNPKNDYCFRIRAENDYGVSDPTRPVTIGRRAVGPVLPHDEPLMYDLGPGSVRLSWRPATLPSFAQAASPITYTIFVQEMPFKTWRPYVKRVPQTWYHISGLNPDKEYNFRVQAENEFGTSKPTAPVFMPRLTDFKRPISMPEIDDFDEDLTSVRLHWKPRAGPPFDMSRSKYLIESWEPVKREWYPVAKGIPDTSYQLKGLPAAPDHLFRVRLETEQLGLSEPSVPVSVSRFYSKRPVHRPQLYELDTDSVRLSWDPAFIPGQTRRPTRYIIEMREIPDKMWNRVASDVLDTNYKIRGLRSKSDYEFRVRAVIDGEMSEPSMAVALYRRAEIPRVRFDVPEVYDVSDDALSIRWNKVDIPTFSYHDEPLSFMIERQTLPGYQWEPVATNLTGTSYRIQDLKPYQDYAFRVRGVYPSGYTEPSPYVPVYRRPSESKISLASRNISSSDSLKLSASQNLPTQSLRASIPSGLPPLPSKFKRDRTSRSYSHSPERRYSLPYVFTDVETKSTVTDTLHQPVRSQSPGFSRKDAYVYNRRKSEDIIPNEAPFKPSYMSQPVKVSKVKAFASEFEGVRSRAVARRHSDFGLGLLGRPRAESSKYYDSALEERKTLVREALAYKPVKPRSSSVPKLADIPKPVPSTRPEYPYRSVADRYEDIKLKYIMGPKAVPHARPHSVSLDTSDYKIHTVPDYQPRRSAYAPSSGQYKPVSYPEQERAYSVDYARPEFDYYDETYFIIEDEMNLNYKTLLPRVSRVDMKAPSSYRSISYDRDPGYFMISKFSLHVSGVRRHSPRKSQVRTQSLEPSQLLRSRSRSNTPAEILRSRVKARSLTPDLDSYKIRSRSESLVRSYSPSVKQLTKTTERHRAMSFTPETYQASVTSTKQTTLTSKPRSNSVSVPTPTRQTVSSDSSWAKARAPAAILIDKSKSLVNRYDEIPGADVLTRSRSSSLSAQPPPMKITTSSQSKLSGDRAKTKILIEESKSLVGKSQSTGADTPKYSTAARRASMASFARPSVAPLSHETVVSHKSSVSMDLSRRDLQPRSKSLSVPPRTRGSVAGSIGDTNADQLRLKLDALVSRLCTPAAKKKHYAPKVTCSRMREETATLTTK